MNNPHHRRPNNNNQNDRGALMNISNLSLSDGNPHHNGNVNSRHPYNSHSASVTAAAINIGMAGVDGSIKPGLNILNQAGNLTQLNANNTSFDPAGQPAAGAVPLPPGQPMNTNMIPSFLIQPSPSGGSSASGSAPQAPAAAQLLMPNQITSSAQIQIPSSSGQIPSSKSRPMVNMNNVQHQKHQHHQAVVQAAADQGLITPADARALFQQQNAPLATTSTSSVTTSTISSTAAAVAAAVGIPPQAVQVQQQHQQRQQSPPGVPQMQHQHQQQQQQVQQQQMPIAMAPGMQAPVYTQKKDYDAYNSDANKKNLMNGRVPATRKDGRKLFVGGLPNEVTDLSFLQYFQQYGEVIDSVVLLDRRTKRSRGFGFVTFEEPNVAASLLTSIPGRTGMVNIHGKNCEVKASEPKTAEAAQYAHSTINLPPPQPHHSHHHNPQQQYNNHHMFQPQQQQQQQQQHQWSTANNQMPQRMGFNAAGTGNRNGSPVPHPLQVNQTMPLPQNSFNHNTSGGAESAGGVPIYSHSTITRTAAGEGGANVNVYIQNNFYTLPPGTELSPSHALNAQPTPEALQAQQAELIQRGIAGAMGGLGQTVPAAQQQYAAPAATAYSSSALQPSYPGPEAVDEGQLQQHQIQQHINTMGHMPYASGQH